MKKATAALKPCPLCGSSNIKAYSTEAVGAYRRGVIRCLDCGCTVTAESGGYHDYPHDDYKATRALALADAKARVAEKWNRRDGK